MSKPRGEKKPGGTPRKGKYREPLTDIQKAAFRGGIMHRFRKETKSMGFKPQKRRTRDE